MSGKGRKVFKFVFGAAAAWAVAVKPRLLHKADLTVFRRYDYSHRGLHDAGLSAPENSLKAFERSAVKGYGITADVRITRDGVPVVFADTELYRMCGTEGEIESLTLQEVKDLTLAGTDQKIPTLKEMLKNVDCRVPILLNLHVKKGNYARLCEAVTRNIDVYDGLFAIESIDPRVLFWFRRQRDEYIRVQMVDYAHRVNSSRVSSKVSRVWDFLCSSLLFNVFAAPDAISENMDNHYAPGTLLCRFLYHVPVIDWTIRNENDYELVRTDGSIVVFDGFEP